MMINCAYLVGCDKYLDRKCPNLEGVKHDIKKMKDALLRYCGCTKENIFVITNTENAFCNPTYTAICRAIEDTAFAYGRTKINNLFFYYSGHGFISKTEDRVPVIIPTDALLNSSKIGVLNINTVSKMILEKFQSVNHIIFILDMCLIVDPYAKGGADEGSIDTCYFPKGVIIFHSCFHEHASFLIPPEHEQKLGKGSAYTCAFIDALRNQDCRTVEDIDNYIKIRINYYNTTLKRNQKPFTSLQDSSLKNVAIRINESLINPARQIKPEHQSKDTPQNGQNHPSQVSLIFAGAQEYERANTINVQLNIEKKRQVMKRANAIDPSDRITISTMGDVILKNLQLLNNYQRFKNNFTFEIYEKAKSYIDGMESNIKSCGQINSTFIEDRKLDCLIEEIKKAIRNCNTLYLNDINQLRRMESNGEQSRLELSMYIISANIAINRNQNTDTTLLQVRKNLFEEYYYSSDLCIKGIKEIINTHLIVIQNLAEYSRVLDAICTKLYNDNYSKYYHKRYNSASLAEVSRLIEKIEQIARSDY